MPPAAAQAPAVPKAETAPSGKAPQTGGITAELMYRLLIGDIALQRGDPALAARAYYEAAREIRDVRLARRATEIALAARQRTLALDAATLWSELDPDGGPGEAGDRGPQGRRRFSRCGSQGRSRARARRSRHVGSRLGEAFLELNRALASEPDKAATFKLVQSLAQPYPNNPEANFAVALAATTPDSPTSSRRLPRCRRSIGRWLRSRAGSRPRCSRSRSSASNRSTAPPIT